MSGPEKVSRRRCPPRIHDPTAGVLPAELLRAGSCSPQARYLPLTPNRHRALATRTPTLCPHPSCPVARATAPSFPSHLSAPTRPPPQSLLSRVQVRPTQPSQLTASPPAADAAVARPPWGGARTPHILLLPATHTHPEGQTDCKRVTASSAKPPLPQDTFDPRKPFFFQKLLRSRRQEGSRAAPPLEPAALPSPASTQGLGQGPRTDNLRQARLLRLGPHRKRCREADKGPLWPGLGSTTRQEESAAGWPTPPPHHALGKAAGREAAPLNPLTCGRTAVQLILFHAGPAALPL